MHKAFKKINGANCGKKADTLVWLYRRRGKENSKVLLPPSQANKQAFGSIKRYYQFLIAAWEEQGQLAPAPLIVLATGCLLLLSSPHPLQCYQTEDKHLINHLQLSAFEKRLADFHHQQQSQEKKVLAVLKKSNVSHVTSLAHWPPSLFPQSVANKSKFFLD
uniref:Uncharacterized protein n=1 Tax=Ditylenchus dipsaci TaxID=166011 RepID=A0A915EFN9_9BILA